MSSSPSSPSSPSSSPFSTSSKITKTVNIQLLGEIFTIDYSYDEHDKVINKVHALKLAIQHYNPAYHNEFQKLLVPEYDRTEPDDSFEKLNEAILQSDLLYLVIQSPRVFSTLKSVGSDANDSTRMNYSWGMYRSRYYIRFNITPFEYNEPLYQHLYKYPNTPSEYSDMPPEYYFSNPELWKYKLNTNVKRVFLTNDAGDVYNNIRDLVSDLFMFHQNLNSPEIVQEIQGEKNKQAESQSKRKWSDMFSPLEKVVSRHTDLFKTVSTIDQISYSRSGFLLQMLLPTDWPLESVLCALETQFNNDFADIEVATSQEVFASTFHNFKEKAETDWV
jgi:hypothetical protein